MNRLIDRMIGTARFQRAMYEEVEHDPDATRQAVVIVAATSVMAGIAGIPTAGALALIGVTLAGIVGWSVYAGLAYYIGTQIFATEQTRGDWREVARTVGFASAPRGLIILGLIPGTYAASSSPSGCSRPPSHGGAELSRALWSPRRRSSPRPSSSP